MCCGIKALLTCCGLFALPHKRCCCFFPLKFGVVIFAIFFLIVDGLILITYAERMNHVAVVKREVLSKTRPVTDGVKKLGLDMANNRVLKEVEQATQLAAKKIEEGGKKVVKQVERTITEHKLNPIEKIKKAFSPERRRRGIDLPGDITIVGNEETKDLSQRGKANANATYGAPQESDKFSSSEGKRAKRAPKPLHPLKELDPVQRRSSEDGEGVQDDPLPGKNALHTLFGLDVENLVLAIVWWVIDWFLLFCVLTGYRWLACVWIFAMIVRCVELVVHAVTIGLTCWWMKHCVRMVFPNIMSVIVFAFIPYAVVIVLSWIITKNK